MSTHHANGTCTNGRHAANGTAAPAPSADGHGGRDGRGRFTAGNRGGPGNPFARQVAELRCALLDEATTDDVRAIARHLIGRARGGDVPACKLLLAYLIGKPAAVVNPDDLDWQEVQQRLRCPPLPDAARRIQEQYRADLLVGLDRAAAVMQRNELADRLGLADEPEANAGAQDEPRPAAARATAESSPGRRRAAAILQRGYLNGAGAAHAPRTRKKKRGGR